MPLPNLFWRGMILTLIPLIVQLSIVCALAYFLHNIKTESVRESKSQELIAQIFTISRDSMELIYSMSTRFEPEAESTEGNPSGSREKTPTVRNLDERVEGALHNSKTDPEMADLLQNLRNVQNRIDEMYAWARRQVYRTRYERITFKNMFFPQLIQTAREHANATSAVILLEQGRQAQNPDRMHKLMNTVWIILAIALLISALLAVFLGYLYVILIKRPLKTICQTGKLLAKREVLPEALSGDDELSSLDRLLHSASDAVEEAAEKERTLIENAADLICSLSADGRIVAANPYTKRILGWTPEELQGKFLHEITVPEESFFSDEKLREARETAELSVFELRLLSASKKIIDTRWSCFWSTSQKVLFCVVHDITESKDAERMKQDLADMISHDLRSPLTSVNISLAILAMGAKGTLEDEQKEKVEAASAQVSNLIELVNDLLDFQKLSAGKIEIDRNDFDLTEAVEKVADTFALKAEEKQVVIDVTGDKAIVHGDAKLFTQALTGLISSSVKVSPQNTIVQINITPEANGYQITITDSGESLPQAEVDTLFYSPFTAKIESVTNRPLLKLSICKLIAQAHGGKMGTNSDHANERCTFWMHIPDSNSSAKHAPNLVFEDISAGVT